MIRGVFVFLRSSARIRLLPAALVVSLLLPSLLGSATPAAAQGFTPTLTPQECSEEPGLASIDASQPTSIHFFNQTSRAMRLYWLDYTGARVPYNTLASRTDVVQPTFMTHPWVLTDETDRCLAIFFPVSTPANAFVSSTIEALSCDREASLRSIASSQRTSILFVNRGPQPAQLYWLDYSGRRQQYLAGLASGTSVLQETFASHAWLVADSTGRCLGIYVASASPGTALITGLPVPIPPPPVLHLKVLPSSTSAGGVPEVTPGQPLLMRFDYLCPGSVRYIGFDPHGAPTLWFGRVPNSVSGQAFYEAEIPGLTPAVPLVHVTAIFDCRTVDGLIRSETFNFDILYTGQRVPMPPPPGVFFGLSPSTPGPNGAPTVRAGEPLGLVIQFCRPRPGGAYAVFTEDGGRQLGVFELNTAGEGSPILVPGLNPAQPIVHVSVDECTNLYRFILDVLYDDGFGTRSPLAAQSLPHKQLHLPTFSAVKR